MEPKQLSLNHDSRNVILPSRDFKASEIRKIAAVLGTEGGKIAVESDAFIYSSLDEFLGSNPEFVTLEIIRTGEPLVRVTIERDEISIDIPESTNEALGILSGLLELLPTKPRRVTFSLGIAFLALPAILLFSIGLTYVVPSTWLNPSFKVLGAIIGTCYIYAVIGAFTRTWKRRRPMRLRTERSTPINWRGVRWDLAKIGLAAFLALMISSLFGK